MYCILYNYTLLLKRQTTDNKGKSTTILFKQCLSSPHFCWGCFTLILNNDERWIKAQLCTVDWIRQHAGESSSIIKPSHYIDWDVCKTFNYDAFLHQLCRNLGFLTKCQYFFGKIYFGAATFDSGLFWPSEHIKKKEMMRTHQAWKCWNMDLFFFFFNCCSPVEIQTQQGNFLICCSFSSHIPSTFMEWRKKGGNE